MNAIKEKTAIMGMSRRRKRLAEGATGVCAEILDRLIVGGTSSTRLRTRPYSSVTILLFLFCVSVLPKESMASSRKVLLTIFDFTSFSYRAELAEYGNPMDSQLVYASTLMVPPKNYSLLCEFPPDMLPREAYSENATAAPSSFITWEYGGPVALLVGLGGCHPLTKAKIALEIQQQVASDLKYIVFYSNDPNDPDAIMALTRPSAPANGTTPPSLTALEHDSFYACEEDSNSEINCVDMQEFGRKMVFVSVSTGTGSAILGRMERLAAATSTRPEILTRENRQWSFPMVLERVYDEVHGNRSSGDSSHHDGVNGGGRYPETYGDGANDSFFWLRSILFTLLIVSPCFRAAYLCYAGGGRIHIRRNAEGLIIGLLYVPPMMNWFGHHQGPEASPIHDRLTNDQVLALPEIVFVKPADDPDCSSGNVDGGNERIKVSDDVSTENSRLDASNTHDTFSGSSLVHGQKIEKLVSKEGETPMDGILLRTNSVNSDSNDDGACVGTQTRLAETHDIQPCPAAEIDKIVTLDGASIEREDEPANLVRAMPTPAVVSTTKSAGRDEEQPVDGIRPTVGPYTNTTCTTCSICIDEFEAGERLRLLPRCGHAFHTECILPWLTERQGCCPLCKTSVMETKEEIEEQQLLGSAAQGDDGSSTVVSTDRSAS